MSRTLLIAAVPVVMLGVWLLARTPNMPSGGAPQDATHPPAPPPASMPTSSRARLLPAPGPLPVRQLRDDLDVVPTTEASDDSRRESWLRMVSDGIHLDLGAVPATEAERGDYDHQQEAFRAQQEALDQSVLHGDIDFDEWTAQTRAQLVEEQRQRRRLLGEDRAAEVEKRQAESQKAVLVPTPENAEDGHPGPGVE